jgi:hypothetical protein
MKNKLIIIVSFLFFGLNNKAYPQNSNFLWAKQMGGISFDRGNSIANDPNGNVYTAGSFMGTLVWRRNDGWVMCVGFLCLCIKHLHTKLLFYSETYL